jgi:hypothetical protein
MNIRQKYIVWKAGYESTPNFWFKRTLLKKIEFEIGPQKGSSWGFFIFFKTYHTYVVVGCVVLVILGGGGGAVYAYSSPSVTEETSLFVIKNSLETIEERLQRTPERRARFYLKKLERREAESEVLRQRHRALEGTENRIKKIENQLERMQGELEYVGSNDIVLKDKIKLRLEYRKNRLHQPEVRAGRTHPSW